MGMLARIVSSGDRTTVFEFIEEPLQIDQKPPARANVVSIDQVGLAIEDEVQLSWQLDWEESPS